MMEKEMVNKKEVNLKQYPVYETGPEIFIEIRVCYFFYKHPRLLFFTALA